MNIVAMIIPYTAMFVSSVGGGVVVVRVIVSWHVVVWPFVFWSFAYTVFVPSPCVSVHEVVVCMGCQVDHAMLSFEKHMFAMLESTIRLSVTCSESVELSPLLITTTPFGVVVCRVIVSLFVGDVLPVGSLY